MTTSLSENSKFAKAVRYRQSIYPQAKKILEKILDKSSFLFQGNKLNILVVGAGTFPSYAALLTVLMAHAPNLQQVNFTLIEPVKSETDFFKDYFSKSSMQLDVHFEIFNVNLEDYLQGVSHSIFDLIYFEHPETMTFPILLAKLGFSRFKRVLTFRKSIPYLVKIISSTTLLIATCMSHHELGQLKSLLTFGLKTNSKLSFSYNFMHFLYGGPYTSGLGSAINFLNLEGMQKKSARAIEKRDQLLVVFVLISIVIYAIKFSTPHSFLEELAGVFFVYTQLLFHRPGNVGLLVKISFLMVQILL